MLNSLKLRVVFAFTLTTALLIGVVNVRLAAQGTIGSILGTVTDSSGSVIAGARVQVLNTGTNATQSTTSDSQGRYRIPALPVGDYDVQGEITGFQTAVRKGVRLSAGADVVVDITLTVGQVTQTVVVEAEVGRVETTSSALGTVVEPQQMRELPLNGRNFEELVQLAPGVNVSRGSGTTKSSFTGKQDYWTVSGSRPNGQEVLMDGTNIQQYQNRGSGSGVLGTSLGVDAIGEFQMLTNTYGAQYGGNGSVMNSVTRSGTNALHGSAYEFARDAIFDATPWPAARKLPFWKQQYGGTLGGPIKKDKMFFFVNYEGLRVNEGQALVNTVPNALAHLGIVPSATALNTGTAPPCTVTTAYAVPAGAAAGTQMWDCGPTSPNAAKFALIKPYLDQYPLGANVGGTANVADASGYSSPEFTDPADLGNGTAQMTVSAQSPGYEKFLVGRYDWNISQKDNIFARYLIDDGHVTEPFYAAWPMWPEFSRSRNQFLTLGHKRVISDTLVNSLQGAYTRTFFDIHNVSQRPTVTPGVLPSGSLNWLGDIYTPFGVPIQDAAINLGSGISALGGGISPIVKNQTRHSISEDLFWIKGAHSFRFGGSFTTVKTDGIHISGTAAGTWAFANLANALRAIPRQFNGVCNYYNVEPACVFNDGTPLPYPNDFRAGRHIEYVIYVQDDWKLRPNLTLNLGLRYSPTNTPTDASNQIYQLLPIPYGQDGGGTQAPSIGVAPPTELTPTRDYFFTNPALHAIDPRIGLAWTPFKNQKTSVRAGYGIFHAIMQCRDYCYGSWFGQPFTVRTSTSTASLATFPYPFQVKAPSTTSSLFGMNPYNTTPYMQQWNLAVQQEIMRNTVLTVAYVGSHGVHLLGQRDSNPPLPSGVLQPYSKLGAITLQNGETLWPNFPGYSNNLVYVSGTGVVNGAAPGTMSCTSPNPVSGPACTIATANGAAIINPATGKQSFAHIVQTSSFTTLSNQRWNPNFAFMLSGESALNSHYHALQVGLNRRLSNNLSAQFGYTYASCIDISSGNWGQEGGNRIVDPYSLKDERGNCTFWTRHNVSTNAMYLLPFKGNRLFEGWQMSGIFYYNNGGPYEIVGITNLGNNVGSSAPRPNLVLGAPGCNGKPTNDPFVTDKGVVLTNAACFAQQAVGEKGNLGRNALIGPNSFNVNASIQKNTKLTERFDLQIRVEGFNIFNRKNFDQPLASTTFTQGATSSAATVVTAKPVPNFGQVTGTTTSMRQLQLGAKLTF